MGHVGDLNRQNLGWICVKGFWFGFGFGKRIVKLGKGLGECACKRGYAKVMGSWLAVLDG